MGKASPVVADFFDINAITHSFATYKNALLSNMEQKLESLSSSKLTYFKKVIFFTNILAKLKQ